MIRRKASLVIGVSLFILVVVCAILWSHEVRRSTDERFELLESHLSPDGNFVLLIYRYDTGAFGYSRTWWAVAPATYTGLNLVPYELPDGYIGVGWEPAGELLVRPWTPYYYKKTNRELRSGEVFRGVTVRLLPEEE